MRGSVYRSICRLAVGLVTTAVWPLREKEGVGEALRTRSGSTARLELPTCVTFILYGTGMCPDAKMLYVHLVATVLYVHIN